MTKEKSTLKNTVFTHNCGYRIALGNLDSGASVVSLDSALGTTIDGSIKGRGIAQSSGVPTFVQFYFAPDDWLQGYFKDRGLDELGNTTDIETKAAEIVLEDSIDINKTIEIEDVRVDDEHEQLDHRDEQKWTEV